MRCLWIVVFSFVLQGCASGSYQLTGEKRPAIKADQVTVFQKPPGFDYEVLGTVQSSSENGFSVDSRKEKAISELKDQAAKIGANGVIITSVTQSSFRGTGVGLGLSVGSGGFGTGLGSGFALPEAKLTGQAIYFPAEKGAEKSDPAASGSASGNN
ncbi:hypothetical protein [Marinomonas spartinae]|uniref:hypothetical protein n=1 Tax=Marinomonas spartinae TaxID=1792290 RepID=UPI00082BAFAD|nr:hypothetical protein [Marinomonas spartinae]